MSRGCRDDRFTVVGAGLGGLSAALHLAGAGREVVVFEQSAGPGGKAGVIDEGGYRLDNGPTVLTMPDLVTSTLAAVGERLEDWLELLPVEPAYRAHYPDGAHLDVRTDPEAMASEISRVCGAREAEGYHRYLRFLHRLYQLEFDRFIASNHDGPLSLLSPDLARLAGLGAFRSLDAVTARYLKDPRTQKLFSFQALYAGTSPRQARGLYAVISYMDTVGGVFLPRGGMHALPRALAAAAAKHGVRFRYGERVIRVERALDGLARAVITAEGDRVPVGAVVLHADSALADPQLLGTTPRRRLRYSPSCLLMLAGARDRPAPEVHHNIHFGGAWHRGFDEIIREGTLMTDPSFLVSVPTVTDPSLAPAGGHCFYILFPTPNLRIGRQNWTADRHRHRDTVLTTLERNGYQGFQSGVEIERMITPEDWQSTGCPAGTPFSVAHTFLQTGPFRPSNRIAGNIVLAGAATHPGVGVPMALISGRLAAERLLGADRGSRAHRHL